MQDDLVLQIRMVSCELDVRTIAPFQQALVDLLGKFEAEVVVGGVSREVLQGDLIGYEEELASRGKSLVHILGKLMIDRSGTVIKPANDSAISRDRKSWSRSHDPTLRIERIHPGEQTVSLRIPCIVEELT